MLGDPVNNCHMRVPVSSNPKYCSVSRFSRTDSRSRTRTRTWAGVAARSANETIGTAPPGETPSPQFHRAREDRSLRVFYRGLRWFANPGQKKERPAPHLGTGLKRLTQLD